MLGMVVVVPYVLYWPLGPLGHASHSITVGLGVKGIFLSYVRKDQEHSHQNFDQLREDIFFLWGIHPKFLNMA